MADLGGGLPDAPDGDGADGDGVGVGEADGPLLRDPPPPPGYVDPIAASEVLDDAAVATVPTGPRKPQVRPAGPTA